MQSLITGEKPMDLNEWAYNTLKRMILDNELPAGCQIKIEEMTVRMGISRTPIREALIRLKQNGLVEAVPRVGFFVCTISRKELKDVFEVRRLIECYAASRCVSIFTDDQIKDLIWHHEQAKLMMEKNLCAEFNVHEVFFHDSIIQSLQNEQINRIRASLNDMIYRQRMVSLESEDNLRCSVAEHASIVKAIVKRDSRNAEAAMNVHICNVEERVTRFLYERDMEKISISGQQPGARSVSPSDASRDADAGADI